MRQTYLAGARQVAVRENGVLSWLLSDHLGSTSLALNAAGTAVAADQRYYAWGSARYESGALPTSRQFTGQIKDATGLYYYNARYYDPALGRFIQPDTIVPDPANPQSLNRYSYVQNNPLKYVDPNGHLPVIPLILIAAATMLLTSNCSIPSAPAAANIRVEHYREYAGQNQNTIIKNTGQSSGSIVGSRTILSHGHYGRLNDPSNIAENITIAGQTYPIGDVHIPYSDAETTLFVLPDGSTNFVNLAFLGDPSTPKIGDNVTAEYWDDANGEFAQLNTTILDIDPNTGTFRLDDPIMLINPGDSGGGVYYKSRLIANIWSIDEDLQGNRLPTFNASPIPQDIADLIQ